MNKTGKIPATLLLFLSFLFLMMFYGDVITKPNNYLFSQSGDAIKNYFTYASHIKENTLIQSDFMNYPYGESFMYLDCQPLLTITLQWLSGPFPAIQNYTIGIINFLMIFSILLSAIFLYLIFNQLDVNKFLSAAGAFSIAVLAPQIFRVTGHLALSYSFFIPLTWYLFIKFTKSRYKLKWSLLILFNNLGWFFIHAYLGMIVSSFILLCFLFDYIFFERSRYSKFWQWLYICLQTFLPIIIFWLFITITDKHIGRTGDPFGFLEYTATFYSVFLPNHPPLRPFFENISIDQAWEGWAYIGAGTLFTLLLFLINRVIRLFKKKSFADDSPLLNSQFIVPAIFSSFILLLLSMGYPFKWHMEFLLDWFPVLKSFRGIGRFAWVFYYVITVSSVYFFFLIYESNKKHFIFLLIAVVLPLSYIWEGIPYHKEMGSNLNQYPNLFDKTQLPASISTGLQYTDKNKYQAIIPLPYYHIGSENYTKSATDKIYRLSMILSYHSEIPLMSNYSTNTSIPESKNLIQVLSPGFYSKAVLNDIKSDKPFLIIYSNDELSAYEKAILDKGIKIYSDNDYSLYSVSKDELFRNTSAEEIRNFEQIKNRLKDVNGFLITVSDSMASIVDTNAVISFNSFEDMPQELSYRGKGSYYGEMKNYNLLTNIELSKLKKDKDYVVSYWMYNEGSDYGQDALNSLTFLEVRYPAGNQEWLSITNPARSVVINGSWSLVEMDFKLPDNASSLTVLLKGNDASGKKIYIDDVLIRAKDSDVYKIMKEENGSITELFKNNHRISL